MSIKVFSPATVANISCGFDIMGFALDKPGDVIEVELNNKGTIEIINRTDISLPLDPQKNVISAVMLAMLAELGKQQGFTITILNKIPAGSGIGSSAASSAAGTFAANELLGNPFTRKKLVEFAMLGEKIASGSAHADNVAPALLGGFTLIRSYAPLDIISIPYPDEMYCAVLHPSIEVATRDSRMILPKEIMLKDAIRQWGNVGGLVAGLMLKDFRLISDSLTDHIVEPIRSILIPGFYNIKNAAISNGALGCSISGSGPSMFALCQNKEIAENVIVAMQSTCMELKLESSAYVSKINSEGTKLI